MKNWRSLGEKLNVKPKDFLNKISTEYYSSEDVEEKAEKIAYFIHFSHYIESNKIMELFTSKDFNKLILRKFINVLDFHGLDIVSALRLLFTDFLMVGEA